MLSFNNTKGGAACGKFQLFSITTRAKNKNKCVAFVVAWGGMAAQAAQLVGLVMLLIDMRQLGVSRVESLIFVVWLVIGIGKNTSLQVNPLIHTTSQSSHLLTTLSALEL